MKSLASSLAFTVLLCSSALASTSDLSLFHTVQAGDSLSSLAKAYKTTVGTLMDLNSLKSERIITGKHVQVPWPDNHLAAAKDLRVVEHVVFPGDSLGGLAERYGSDADCIRLLNRLSNDQIKVGQLMRIPTAGGAWLRKDVTYTVGAGDTLGSISRAHGVRTLVLRHLNPGAQWSRLKIGKSLRLVRWEQVVATHVDVEALIEEVPKPFLVPVPAPDAGVTTTQGPASVPVPKADPASVVTP